MTHDNIITVRIPDELSGYEPQLRRFIDAMIYKLRKNSHKGKWEGMEIKDLLIRLKEETAELEDAIRHGNTMEIVLESVDISNFAMMICAVATEDNP